MLTLLFIALKLTGVIAWSWLWVFSPIWLVTALVIVGCIIYVRFFSYQRNDERKAIKKPYRMHKVNPNEKRVEAAPVHKYRNNTPDP